MQRPQPDGMARYASHGPGRVIRDVLPNATVWAYSCTKARQPLLLVQTADSCSAGYLSRSGQWPISAPCSASSAPRVRNTVPLTCNLPYSNRVGLHDGCPTSWYRAIAAKHNGLTSRPQ